MVQLCLSRTNGQFNALVMLEVHYNQPASRAENVETFWHKILLFSDYGENLPFLWFIFHYISLFRRNRHLTLTLLWRQHSTKKYQKFDALMPAKKTAGEILIGRIFCTCLQIILQTHLTCYRKSCHELRQWISVDLTLILTMVWPD